MGRTEDSDVRDRSRSPLRWRSAQGLVLSRAGPDRFRAYSRRQRVTRRCAARADSNNSLGATPLMGWRNWSYIESDPTTAKIEAQATVMKSSGLLSYGYQYINLLPVQLQRPEVNANGPWKVDPSKFPQRRLDPGHGGPGQLLPRRGREGRRVCDPASPVTR
jgi:hypothetical protein